MNETRGMAAGVKACKEFLARQFELRIAGVPLTGFDIAKMIRASVGPDVSSEQKESRPVSRSASAP